jgi:hypothetical protein
VIRLTGDARFAKVVIRRGRHDPHARPAVFSVQ